jgi:hypothetical protein
MFNFTVSTDLTVSSPEVPADAATRFIRAGIHLRELNVTNVAIESDHPDYQERLERANDRYDSAREELLDRLPARSEDLPDIDCECNSDEVTSRAAFIGDYFVAHMDTVRAGFEHDVVLCVPLDRVFDRAGRDILACEPFVRLLDRLGLKI